MHRPLRVSIRVTAVAILALAPQSVLAGYLVTDVGASLQPAAINGAGGIAANASGHAYVYDGSGLQDLGSLGGTTSIANGINDAGNAVG